MSGDSPRRLDFRVAGALAGQRLDKALCGLLPGLSRAAVQRAITAGACRIDGMPVSTASLKLRAGQEVVLALPDTANELRAEEEAVDILWQDEHLLLCNKPAGLTVHPCPSCPENTLVQRLLHHFPRLREQEGLRPGVVHRLDKDTSGLVLAAQNGYAAPLLAQRVEKLYYAVAEGELPLGPGVIDAPIGRQGESIIGRCVTPDGKPSRTEYTILKAENGLSLAACVPVTGRTHQIRVHFASIGHPLAGDDLYGGSRARIGRQALHCAKQTFWVPRCERMPDGIRIEVPVDETTLRPVTVESPLPEDMAALFD